MKLNGWQRLWVVVMVMWLLPVMGFSYELWPTTANVPKGDVYSQLKPNVGRRLSDYYDFVEAPQIDFSKYVSLQPDGTTVSNSSAQVQPLFDMSKAIPIRSFSTGISSKPDQPSAVPAGQSSPLFDMSKAVPVPQGGTPAAVVPNTQSKAQHNQPLSVVRSEPLPGPIADIDGHKVQFYEGVSQEDMNQTTRGYSAILHHMLSVKRAAFIAKMFGFWMVPMVGLYLAGWAIAWVRRGFRQVA